MIWEFGGLQELRQITKQEAFRNGTQKCSTKRGVREPLRLEVALNNRELVKAEVFENSSKRPHYNEAIRRTLSLNNLLVGTVRPPVFFLQLKFLE